MSKLIFIVFFIGWSFYSLEAQTKSISIRTKKKLNQTIRVLKKNNYKYKVQKVYKKRKIYYLFVTEAPAGVKFNKKVKIKKNGRTLYLQFRSYSISKTKKERQKLLNLGVPSENIVFKSNLEKRLEYRVTYQKGQPTGLDLNRFSKNISLVSSSMLMEVAGSPQESEYASYWIDLLSGVKYSKDQYSGVFTLRYEDFFEEHTPNTGQEKQKYNFNKLDINETYFELEKSRFIFTLGKQLFSWGVFDESSQFDRVNIKNNPRFVFDYGAEIRRPITVLRIQYFLDNFKIDSFVDFGLEEGRIPESKQVWSGIDQTQGRIRGLELDNNMAFVVQNVTVHNEVRSGTGYGVRISNSNDYGDFSFNFLNTFAGTPFVRFSDELRTEILSSSVSANGLNSGVIVGFSKEAVFGFDYSNAIGDNIVRAEIAHTSNYKLVDEALETQETGKTSFGFGGERYLNFINAQILFQILYESIEINGLNNRNFDSALFYQLSKTIYNEKFTFGLRQIRSIADSSFFTSLYAQYNSGDVYSCTAKYNLFSGAENSFFGYHNNDGFLSLNFKVLF